LKNGTHHYKNHSNSTQHLLIGSLDDSLTVKYVVIYYLNRVIDEGGRSNQSSQKLA